MSGQTAAPRPSTLVDGEAPAGVVLRAEEALYFRLAAPRHAAVAARALAGRGMDWGRLVAIVLKEGVAGGFWRTLADCGLQVPPEAAGQLQGVAALSDFRLMAVRRLLEKTVAQLAEHGIPVMLVKGAALSAFVYGEPNDRNMADLDLVVPAEQAREAAMLARSKDWTIDMAELKAALYEEHHHLPPMSDTLGLDIRLEIHTDVLPNGHPLAYGAAAIRGRATRRRLGASEVLVPSIEDLLVYSCVHLAWSHEMRVGGWRTFRDVAELVERPDFAWDRFLAIARDRSLAPACYWTLLLAQRLCGVPVPAEVLRALDPGVAGWLSEVVARHFILQLVPMARRNPSEGMARLLWTCGMRPGRAGHGGARPWQFGERKIEKSRELGLGAPGGAARWWAHRVGISDAADYLRRLAGR
ncbi:MAG TPA: nucleotidyltransferase family protein [Gemmatimonadaceae bacterium]|nr:nucleotidyltransferase family protein [Gemmatimonadaceae bacterium]